MNDNLPPLPEPFCFKHEDAGTYWPDTFSAEQMKAYARAAIEKDRAERQCVPAGYSMVPVDLTAAMWSAVNKVDDSAFADGNMHGADFESLWNAALAAAPQPEPGPMAETVEEAARDVQKCLNERDGHGLDLRHVAMLVHHVQQAQGEKQ